MEKYVTFKVPIKKEVTRIDKNGEEMTKNVYYILQLLIAQDLWQDHYQILSLIFLKEIMKLNVNVDTMIKKMKFVE